MVTNAVYAYHHLSSMIMMIIFNVHLFATLATPEVGMLHGLNLNRNLQCVSFYLSHTSTKNR